MLGFRDRESVGFNASQGGSGGTVALYAWGFNNQGQLGLGNTTNYSTPKQVGGLSNWTSNIATAGATVLAIKADNTLWSWGYNSTGQLGLGNTTNYSSPKQVGNLTNWASVSCCNSTNSGGYSNTHVLAIKKDGTLWGWGLNAAGQLGLGNTTNYSSPKQIGANSWLQAACGLNFSCAIRTDGTLWSWGINTYGQLGINSSTTYFSSPKQVGGLTNWAAVRGYNYHVLAIKSDGTLWSWGLNNMGQLGLGISGTNYSSPKQVGLLTTWKYLNTGDNNEDCSLAIKSDGTLWSWGYGTYGQLGYGTSNVSSPKQVASSTSWSAVSGGFYWMLAAKTDGTIWSWGKNQDYQLGLGVATYYSSPKQIGSLTSWLGIAGGGYSGFAIR